MYIELYDSNDLKNRSSSPNVIIYYGSPNDVYLIVWSKSVHWYRRQSADNAFSFIEFYDPVDLGNWASSVQFSNIYFMQIHSVFNK